MASLVASAALVPALSAKNAAPVAQARPRSSFLGSLTLSRRAPSASLAPRLHRAVRAEAVDAAVMDAPAAELLLQPLQSLAPVEAADAVEAVEAVPSEVGSFLSSFVESTRGMLEDAAEEAKDLFAEAVDAVSDAAESAVDAATDAMDSVKLPTLPPAASSASPVAADAAADAVPAVEADFIIPEIPEAISGVDAPLDAVPSVPGEAFSAPPSMPQFSAPDFKAPDFKAPDFKVPDFKVPDFKAPDFKAPDFNFKVPEFKAPGFTLPEFKRPELPELKAPEFSLPDFSDPSFSLQDTLKAKLSEFSAPELSLPDSLKDKISLPQFALPESIKSKLPDLPSLPSLPSVPNPAVPLPRLSLPPAVTEPVKAAVADAQAAIEEKAGLAASVALEQAALLYGQVKEQVPAEYQPYVAKVETNLQDLWVAAKEVLPDAASKVGTTTVELVQSAYGAAGYEVDESVVNATLIGIGSSFLIVAYYRAVYGGYAGDLPPQETLKRLREGRAVLLDLRPEVVRTAEGIPDLRRGARFKDKSLEFDKYSGALRRDLRNPESVDLQLFSAKLRGLKGVSRGSGVIVMDESGSNQAKDIARGLAKYGFERSFVLEGGFKAWQDEGLLVKPNEDQPLAEVLANEFEAFVEEVKPTPEGVLTVLLGVGVGVYALYEWEKSAQILAFLLIAQIIYSRAKTYQTSADLDRDVRFVTAPFWLVATVLGWVVKLFSGPSAPPKLATAGADVEAAEEQPQVAASSAAKALPAVAETATAPPPAPPPRPPPLHL